MTRRWCYWNSAGIWNTADGFDYWRNQQGKYWETVYIYANGRYG